eukprot:scaffold33817_cov78-Phaeocystis_antarctica.AAC.1
MPSHRVMAEEHGEARRAAIFEQVLERAAWIVHERVRVHVHKPTKWLAHHFDQPPHAVEHGIRPAAQRANVLVERVAAPGSVALMVRSRDIEQRRVVGVSILVDHEPCRPGPGRRPSWPAAREERAAADDGGHVIYANQKQSEVHSQAEQRRQAHAGVAAPQHPSRPRTATCEETSHHAAYGGGGASSGQHHGLRHES